MSYLIDVGSSTIKIYTKADEIITLLESKTFNFKDNFNAIHGLTSEIKSEFYSFFERSIKKYNLNKSNTKLFATGIFRELQNRQLFIEEFYTNTQLYFNIISHDLEAFYLENLEKSLLTQSTNIANLLLINIGGKTTELVVRCGDFIAHRIKLNIGVGTVLKNFAGINDTYSRVKLNDILRFIQAQLPDLNCIVTDALYTGGELTFMQLAKYPLIKNCCFADEGHPFMIPTSDFIDKNNEIFYNATIDDLRCLMPANPMWMDGARACSAIAQAICERYSIQHIVPSDFNLINGVAVQEARKIVICGSFNRHLDKIELLMKELKEKGVDVLSPSNVNVVGIKNDFILFEHDNMINNCTWSIESQHLKAIDACDIVLVCNYDNYVGIKTSLEIGYAYKANKKIVFIESNDITDDFDIPSEISLL